MHPYLIKIEQRHFLFVYQLVDFVYAFFFEMVDYIDVFYFVIYLDPILTSIFPF